MPRISKLLIFADISWSLETRQASEYTFTRWRTFFASCWLFAWIWLCHVARRWKSYSWRGVSGRSRFEYMTVQLQQRQALEYWTLLKTQWLDKISNLLIVFAAYNLYTKFQLNTLFFIRILFFFRPGLNSFILLPILGWNILVNILRL